MLCRMKTDGLFVVRAVKELRQFTAPSVRRLMQVERSLAIKILNFLSTAEMAASESVMAMGMTRFHRGDECTKQALQA